VRAAKTKKAGAAKSKTRGTAVVTSICGQYLMSSTNEAYFTDQSTLDFLAQNKERVYSSLEEFREKVLNEINSRQTRIKYQASLTAKYLRLTCSCCKKFAFWFRNKDGIEIGEISDMNKLHVQLFRSINQNHTRAEHSSIKFSSKFIKQADNECKPVQVKQADSKRKQE